ncbi:MAG: hypothetical protein N2C12_01065, partial [Planctomycetales bacterium]
VLFVWLHPDPKGQPIQLLVHLSAVVVTTSSLIAFSIMQWREERMETPSGDSTASLLLEDQRQRREEL